MNPSYKNVAAGVATVAQASAPTTHANGITGLVHSVVGRTAPTYKTPNGQSAQAPTSAWSIFGNSPPYKTAPPPADNPSDTDPCAPCVDVDGVCDPGPDDIVVL